MTSFAVRRLQVHLPSRTTGELYQDGYGSTHWVPEPSWARTQLPRLGLDFYRAPGRRQVAQDLPPWFENLLPERESPLRARLTAMFGLRDGQSLRLVEALGRELPGAVEVRPASEGSSHSEGSSRELENPVLQGTRRDPSPDEDHPPRPSSLAGIQLKASMSMVGDHLTFGVRSKAGSEWIVKFPGEHAELSEVETATMTWAKQAGFDVPHHCTMPFDALQELPQGWVESSPTIFAIQRFDRRPDGTRVHHEDLCQALGFRPLDKYGDRPPHTIHYEGALKLVLDACGESSARELARRLGFVIASGNTDAHLKNWGLLWGDRVRPDLTPCYDLVCTIAWERYGWQRQGGPRLALWFGTTHRFADIGEEMLNRFAASAQAPWAAEEIHAGIVAARDTLRWIRAPVPQRMREALVEHWKRVPLLRRFAPAGGVFAR